MSAIDYIETSCTAKITGPDGLVWAVQRVSNALARQRGAILRLMVLPASPADRAEEEDARQGGEGAVAALLLARSRRWLEDEAHREMEENTRLDLICLGVVAVALPERPLEPVQLVRTEAEHDTAASPPRVWLGRINAPTQDALHAAIWDLCTDGGAARRRIERFLNGG